MADKKNPKTTRLLFLAQAQSLAQAVLIRSWFQARHAGAVSKKIAACAVVTKWNRHRVTKIVMGEGLV